MPTYFFTDNYLKDILSSSRAVTFLYIYIYMYNTIFKKTGNYTFHPPALVKKINYYLTRFRGGDQSSSSAVVVGLETL